MARNKKIAIALVLITALLLLSSIASARPVTDVFTGGLMQINDFFENRAYEPYSKAIDFFFFSLLFIAVYMMGARYAFKEIKRPEQVIVILLGLMTAFLLVLADISATVLLPYIHWLLYLLLFILYWHLLKGIKNPFWRFVLALLLTLLTIGLIQGLYNYLKAPEISGIRAPEAPSIGIGGFFKDLFGSFKGISLPGVSAPGVPDWAKNLFGAPTGPTATGPTPLPPAVTPTPIPKEEGFSKWWLLLLLLIFIFKKPRDWVRRGWGRIRRRPQPTPSGELTIDRIVALIEEIINKKREAKNKINEKVYEERTPILKSADRAQAFVNSYTKDDIAHIWEDPVRTKIREAGEDFLKFVDKDKEFVTELKKLKDVEVDLHRKLEGWKRFFDDKRIVYGNVLQELVDIIAKKTDPRQIKQIGIIWLIVICYNYVKRDENYAKELAHWLTEDNIENLLKDRFETIHQDGKKLRLNVASEIEIVRIIGEKIELQIRTLEELKNKIRGAAPAPTPLVPKPTVHPKWKTEEGEFSPIPPEKPVYPIQPVIPPPKEPKPTKYEKFSVDLSEWFMPIKNQGETNACAAFAGAAIMEYLINKKLNKKLNEVDLEKALSELFLWYEIRPDKQSNIGVYSLGTAPASMQKTGVCFDLIWPWLPIDKQTMLPTKYTTRPTEEAYFDASEKRIFKYRPLSIYDPDSWIKELGTNENPGNPILLGMRVEPTLDLVGKAKNNLWMPPPETISSPHGHAVVVVGFTTDFPNPDPKSANKTFAAFKIRNSSGSGWGENGYIWVPYIMLPQILTQEPYVIEWKYEEAEGEPKGLLTAGITEIEELKIEPIEAEASRGGVEYGTPLTISSKIISGIAPFKAYCFIYKYEISETGAKVKRAGKDIFKQIFPPKPEAISKADERQLGFEFNKELGQIDLRARWEDYKRTIELTSKTRQQIWSRITYETGKDIPFLEPGQYKVVFYVRDVRDTSQLKKQSWTFKAVDIKINESKRQLKFEFEEAKKGIQLQIVKPSKASRPYFTVGGRVYEPLEVIFEGNEKIIDSVTKKHTGYKVIWWIEQEGIRSARINEGIKTDSSSKAIPENFRQGTATLRVILYDKSSHKIAEDSMEVELLKGGAIEPYIPKPKPPEPNPNDILNEFDNFANSVGDEIERRRQEGKRVFDA